MFQLELSDAERDALAQALTSFLSELRTEVSHTDRQSYRERLKDQEQLLREIHGRLQRPG